MRIAGAGIGRTVVAVVVGRTAVGHTVAVDHIAAAGRIAAAVAVGRRPSYHP